MKEVLIRKQMLHGNVSNLTRAQVLSEKDGVLRVKVEGERLPRDVKAAETIPADRVFDTRDKVTVIAKSYPDSLYSLHSRLNGAK